MDRRISPLGHENKGVSVGIVNSRRKQNAVNARRIIIRAPRLPTHPPKSNGKLLHVVTPRYDAPPCKTALHRGTVLWEEVEVLCEISRREGRAYHPKNRRHLVQQSIRPHAPSVEESKGISGRASSVTECSAVTMGRRPVPGATPQHLRRRNKRFYHIIDVEDEEVPHELDVQEDEAIPSERRPGYDTGPRVKATRKNQTRTTNSLVPHGMRITGQWRNPERTMSVCRLGVSL